VGGRVGRAENSPAIAKKKSLTEALGGTEKVRGKLTSGARKKNTHRKKGENYRGRVITSPCFRQRVANSANGSQKRKEVFLKKKVMRQQPALGGQLMQRMSLVTKQR